MASPGISVHPIVSIDGGHELNRIEFVDVRVPVTNRIGDEGRGWYYANVLLQGERLSYAHIARKRADLTAIRSLAARTPADDGATMADDALFRRRMAECEIEVDALEIAVLRALTGDPTPATVSAMKIMATECAQHVTELHLELAGRNRAPLLDRSYEGWADAAPLVPAHAAIAVQTYFFTRAQTIYGGATEIQKTIIWRSLA